MNWPVLRSLLQQLFEYWDKTFKIGIRYFEMILFVKDFYPNIGTKYSTLGLKYSTLG